MENETCNIRMSSGILCGRPIKRDGKCIFHLEGKTDEECTEFNDKFQSVLNTGDLQDFTGFIFLYVIFDNINFRKDVHFNNAKFQKDVIFANTIFDDDVTFNEAEFCGEVYSSNTVFNGDVYFNNVKFKNNVSFESSKFNKIASFDRAIFNSFVETNDVSASFHKAEFNTVSFFDTKFETTDVDFSFARFNDKTIFYMTTFNKKTRFSNANFFGDVYFMSINFGEHIVMIDKVQFHKICQFNSVDLRNVCFLSTDVTEVEFFDVTWKKKNKRNITVAENFAGDNVTNVTYAAVSQLYRRLRMSYEKKYMFTEAGDFFIGEMEMRRKNVTTKNKKLKKIILWCKRNFCVLGIYKHLSDYGENYLRPIRFSIIFIFLYQIVIYLLFRNNGSLIDYIHNSYWCDLKDSTKSFFQMNDRYLIERLLGILILGSIFISFKRKFERNR